MEDSRLKRSTITHPTLPLERTFCAECGKPWGWASMETSKTIAPAEIQVICENCLQQKTDQAGLPPAGTITPMPSKDWLTAHGLYDEHDERVKITSTAQQTQVEKVFTAMTALRCPGCGSSDYSLIDNVDNPEGPQVAICNPCSSHGLRKGWALRERLDLSLVA